MRVPLGWLASFIALPASQDELEAKLTSAGLEIQQVIQTGPDISALQVGRVLHCERHPNADRLFLCRVDLGGDEPLEIVCGASNVAAGQFVAVATHGALLPGGLRIKRSKIRGVVSNGMICSERELGLGDEHDGILVLDGAPTPGAKLSQVLNVMETVFDIEITPNRGDLVSMHGIAREVRALFGGALRLPECQPEETEREATSAMAVSIQAPQDCHRYLGRVLCGVQVAPSPDWLQRRLEAAGLRSINNAVDATNLVMLEFGQPLHAFDLDKLRSPLCVRRAEPGETLRTLDGEARALEPEDLLIADAAGPQALAGVMGGAASEVSDNSVNLLLESAHFAPACVRRSARRLGLSSDASYRFERGVDPDGQARALDRAARLITELAGGEVLRGHIASEGAPAKTPPLEIPLDAARLRRLLGVELSEQEIIRLLACVEVQARSAPAESGTRILCQPPRYRSDLLDFEDLAEEVARIYGYDAIPATLPSATPAGVSRPQRHATRDAVKASLVASGLIEVMTAPWISERELDDLRLPADDPARRSLKLQNPVHSGRPLLRTQLVSALLRVAEQNLNRQVEQVRLFECGRVFHACAAEPDALPEEPLQAVALLAGAGSPGLWRENHAPLFFRIKGIAERLLEELGQPLPFRAGSAPPFLHPAASGVFELGGQSAIAVGELHPECLAAFALDTPVALAVIGLDRLDAVRQPQQTYQVVSRHPSVQRDLALLFDRELPAAELLAAIRQQAGAILASVEVFDRYEGLGVPEGRVSLAFRLLFQHTERTLTDAEVTKALQRILQFLSKNFDAEQRLAGESAASQGGGG